MFNVKNLKDLRDLEKDDVLGYLGLQTKHSGDWVAPALAAFGAGLVFGIGVGLMLAPKSGNELRSDLRTRLQSGNGGTVSNIGNSAGAEQRT